MASLRRHEGYLLMDHRESPGLSDAEMRAASLAMGLPPPPQGAGRGLFEAPVITCSHCRIGVVINPDRSRERAYCPKCDHYICDACEFVRVSTGVCRSFESIIDQAQERAVKREHAPLCPLGCPVGMHDLSIPPLTKGAL